MDRTKPGTNNTDERFRNNVDPQDAARTNISTRPPIEAGRERDEEFAAEMTVDDVDRTANAEEDEEKTEVNSVLGWIAVVASIISFFMMPIILGAVGIILGFMARNRGAGVLGYTAIIAGAISILITLFILPYV